MLHDVGVDSIKCGSRCDQFFPVAIHIPANGIYFVYKFDKFAQER